MSRDRDPAGRPRNARPRDSLGRPLARGKDPGPGTDRIPDDLQLTGTDAVRLADQLMRAGRPFAAHEVLEASWKSGPAGERDLWQGLAQIAVGYTHASRGNARGAVTLLRRGAERVRGYRRTVDDDGPYGIDLPAVLAAADDLAASVERGGLADIPPADLRPRLIHLSTPNPGPCPGRGWSRDRKRLPRRPQLPQLAGPPASSWILTPRIVGGSDPR